MVSSSIAARFHNIWGKYATAGVTIKALRDEVPTRLHDHIIKTMYTTRRSNGVRLFYDDSKRKIGKQAIGNRLKDIFDQLNSPLTLNESNDSIRRMLKRAFGMEKTVNTNDHIVLSNNPNPIPTSDNV